MAKIETPVENFDGTVVGVRFEKGKAETDDEGAINYFRRHGYKVTGAKEPKAPKDEQRAYPEGEPGEGWTHNQLDALAKELGVDVSKAANKHEKLEMIARHKNNDPLVTTPQQSDNPGEDKIVNPEDAGLV